MRKQVQKSQTKKLLGILFLVCFCFILRPTGARADQDNYFGTYEELMEVIQKDYTTYIYLPTGTGDFGWPSGKTVVETPNKKCEIQIEADWEIPANVTLKVNGVENSEMNSAKLIVKGTVMLEEYADETGSRQVRLPDMSVENGGQVIATAELSLRDTAYGRSRVLTVKEGGTVNLNSDDWLFVYGGTLDLQGGKIEGIGTVALRAGTVRSTNGSEISCAINVANGNKFDYEAGEDVEIADSFVEGDLTIQKGIFLYEGRLLVNGTLRGQGSISNDQGGLAVPNGSTCNLDSEFSLENLTVENGGVLNVNARAAFSGQTTIKNGGTMNLNLKEDNKSSSFRDYQGKGNVFTVETGGVLNVGHSLVLYNQAVLDGTVHFTENAGIVAQAGVTLDGSGKLTGTGVVYLRGDKDASTGQISNLASISDKLKANKDDTVIISWQTGETTTPSTPTTKTNLSQTTVSKIGKKTYTGKALTPSVTVKDGSTTLKKGTDYTVSYKNNINVGTATITIKGKGNYTGTKTTTFQIVAGSASKVTVENASYNSLKLKWKKVSGASGYIIYRADKKGGSYKKLATVKKGSTVTYTDKKLTTGKTYYYKVRAYKTINKKDTVIMEFAANSGKPAPSVPKVKLTAGKAAVTVKITKVSGATGYEIYRSEKKSSGFKLVKTVKGTSYKDSGKLKAKKTYYYKVRAYRTVNGKKVYSAYTEVMNCKTK
ncbi:MAG: hypothetical protein Q4F41_15705 [Eubacteriales bacterium]|nr:hypothetical protein [Eubacteriales bacterium]